MRRSLSPQAPKDFFKRGDSFWGVLLSLLWHSFWFLFFIPIFPSPHFRSASSRAIFLGDILKSSDFSVSSRNGMSWNREVAGVFSEKNVSVDFSRDLFDKEDASFFKPEARLYEEPQNLTLVNVSRSNLSAAEDLFLDPDKVTFGLEDYTKFVSGVDFSDLKRVPSREDISSFLEFYLVVGPDGRVLSIKKISGSGDPALDGAVIRKLRLGLFHRSFCGRGEVRVRFYLKRQIR